MSLHLSNCHIVGNHMSRLNILSEGLLTLFRQICCIRNSKGVRCCAQKEGNQGLFYTVKPVLAATQK